MTINCFLCSNFSLNWEAHGSWPRKWALQQRERRKETPSRGQELTGPPAASTLQVTLPKVFVIKPGKDVTIYLYLIILLVHGGILDCKIISEQGVYIITRTKKQNCWKISPYRFILSSIVPHLHFSPLN